MNTEDEKFPMAFFEDSIEAAEFPTPRPGLIDVVKINGKWAQVLVAGNVIRFLHDNSEYLIDWNVYMLIRKWCFMSVGLYQESFPDEISDAQIDHIYWGADDPNKTPHLKRQVNVFGEYKKRDTPQTQ